MKTNLVTRKVLTEDVCDYYHQFLEDTVHALWQCPCLSPIYDSNSMWDFQRTSIFNSFVDLFKFIIDRGKNLELLAILVFTIWNRINLLHASDKSFPITQVLPNTVSAHVDFLHTLLDDLPTLNPCVSFRAMWIPSPHPMFKVNFDAWFSDFDYS